MPQAVADNAAGAVAAGQKLRVDYAGLPGCCAADDGVDAIFVLGERGECPAETDVDVYRTRFKEPLERRFEHHL